jgi:hypothetical protein
MECLAFRRDDGRVEVVIERGIVQEAFGIFADTPAAVRTALRFEAEMLGLDIYRCSRCGGQFTVQIPKVSSHSPESTDHGGEVPDRPKDRR